MSWTPIELFEAPPGSGKPFRRLEDSTNRTLARSGGMTTFETTTPIDHEALRAALARYGVVTSRTLCQFVRAETSHPETPSEVAEANAEHDKTFKACGRYILKLYKQGALRRTRKAHFVPGQGRQPAEYVWA